MTSTIDTIDSIIWEDDSIEWSDQLEGLMRYICTDTLIGWYVDEVYVRDFNEMALIIGEEKAKLIEDYYYSHCR